MKHFAATLLLSALASLTHATEPQWQSIDSVAAAAKAHAETHGLKVGVKQTIEAGPVDHRLRLTQCPTELSTAFAPGVKSAARMTVEVRCPGAASWRVYVPVQVKAFDAAVVTTRPLERGHVLTADDITTLETQVGDLPNGYARAPGKVMGLRLSRAVVAGTVLTPSIIQIEPLIRRGDSVIVMAQSGSMAIRAQGVALGTGGVDSRIKIKNLSSGREVEGVIRNTGMVEILLH